MTQKNDTKTPVHHEDETTPIHVSQDTIDQLRQELNAPDPDLTFPGDN